MCARTNELRRQYITCPGSAHLEEIEYEIDPEGEMIARIASCTVFDPPQDVTCEEECRRRMNMRIQRRRNLP